MSYFCLAGLESVLAFNISETSGSPRHEERRYADAVRGRLGLLSRFYNVTLARVLDKHFFDEMELVE